MLPPWKGLAHAPLNALVLTRSLAVYADWCGPCKAIAPVYEQLSTALSRPGKVTFTRIDVDAQKELAARYGITA